MYTKIKKNKIYVPLHVKASISPLYEEIQTNKYITKDIT